MTTAPAPADNAAAAPAVITAPSTTPAPGDNGVAFGTPANGSPAPAAPATAPNSSDIWAGLTAENLAVAKSKNWADLNAAVKSYADLEKAYGSKSAAAPAAPAEIAAYSFGKPEDLPAGVNYDEGFAGKFKEWAFAHKVPVEQAKGIHDSFVKYAADTAVASNAKITERIASTKAELNKTWGPDGTPQFNRQLELSVRAADKLGVMEDLKALGAVMDVGGKTVVANPNFAKMLAQVGQAMFAEDSIHGSAASSVNPFDPKSENQTLAGQIFKQDPQKAKALIYAAGQQEKFASLLATIK
jgi:hypothetical protein